MGGADSLATHALWLQRAAARGVGYCRPFIRLGAAHHRRSCGFRVARARRGALRPRATASERRAPHVDAAAHGDGACRAMVAALKRAADGRRGRLREPAWHRHACERSPPGAPYAIFGDVTPCSSTGRHRAHARRGRNHRRSRLSLEYAFGWQPTTREVDPDTQCAIALRGEAGSLARDEQQLRLRRQQPRAGVRKGSDARRHRGRRRAAPACRTGTARAPCRREPCVRQRAARVCAPSSLAPAERAQLAHGVARDRGGRAGAAANRDRPCRHGAGVLIGGSYRCHHHQLCEALREAAAPTSSTIRCTTRRRATTASR